VLPVGQHLSTIGNVGDFFALLVSHPFKGSGAKPARGHKKGKAENGTASNRDDLSAGSPALAA
jgi:hypothetical protein